jgi:hypothetical protein
LLAGAQVALFSDLWRALAGNFNPQPVQRHLQALESALTLKHRSGPRLRSLPENPSLRDIRIVKQRYATVRGTYRAFIGAMGNLIFLEALGATLSRWEEGSESPSLLRGFEFGGVNIWSTQDKFESRDAPQARYWHPAAVGRPYGPYMDLDHRLAIAVIERTVLIPKDRALYRLRRVPNVESLFAVYLPMLQAERVALRDWLRDHAGEDEGGAPSLPSWQESVAGLPAENIASTLHILHPWVGAMAEHAGVFSSFEELQICTLQNIQPLFFAPAGLTHEQLQWLLGRPPRPARAMRPNLLFARRPDPNRKKPPKLVAHWDTGPDGPDMARALLHPARCGGLKPIALCGEDRLEAIGRSYRAFGQRHLGATAAPSRDDGSVTPVEIAAFLSVLEMGVLALQVERKLPRLSPRRLEDRFPHTRSRRH